MFLDETLKAYGWTRTPEGWYTTNGTYFLPEAFLDKLTSKGYVDPTNLPLYIASVKIPPRGLVLRLYELLGDHDIWGGQLRVSPTLYRDNETAMEIAQDLAKHLIPVWVFMLEREGR